MSRKKSQQQKAENVSKNEIEIAVTYFLSSLLLIVFFFLCFLACLAQFNVFMVSFGACCETHELLPFISRSLTPSHIAVGFARYSRVSQKCL
jgi:hypothetical protein